MKLDWKDLHPGYGTLGVTTAYGALIGFVIYDINANGLFKGAPGESEAAKQARYAKERHDMDTAFLIGTLVCGAAAVGLGLDSKLGSVAAGACLGATSLPIVTRM